MSYQLPELPLRRLPIDARPAAGEPAESFVRRLARANHLRPSYLRRYVSGPPGYNGKIDPQRLASLTGRPADILQKTLTASGWPRPARPPSGRLRRRHADKPALYARIRAAARPGNLSKTQLATRFRVGHCTIDKALAAPQPPPWKPPFKKNPPSYAARIDALLQAAPGLTARQLWELLADGADLKISYGTVSEYYRRRRQAIPGPGHSAVMELNPPGQYLNDGNLRARQRLWQCQVPAFNTTGWILDQAGLRPGMRVLDAGCGNGLYLPALRQRQVTAVGCDLSPGMLATITHPALVTADVTALPIRDHALDAVLAAQMLDLVPDRATAISELRRVLAPGGTCLIVATGAQHLRSLRHLIERAARTPGWHMHPPTGSAFTLENAPAQLATAFADLTCVRPPATEAVITDASIAADYTTSLAGHYQHQVTRPWTDIADDVRHQVQNIINTSGQFRTAGDLAAIICR